MNWKMTICALTLAAVSHSPAVAQRWLKMVVGTYTNGSSKGLYSFAFDQTTGRTRSLSSLQLDNPSFLTFAPSGKMFYTVCENNTATASVAAVSFQPRTGKMRLVSRQPTHGADPCHVATNGKILISSNYTGGSMSVFPLGRDGRILPMSQQFQGSVASNDFPQLSTPHVHCARFSPNGHEVLASDFSGNRLLRFTLGKQSQLQAAGVAAQASRNTGLRHFTWSADSRFLYALGEVSGAVSVFRYTAQGEMERIQEIQADTVEGHGAADIHLSPDGQWLYASLRLKNDGIAIFSVNPDNGQLTLVAHQPTGTHPRHFNITPNGRFLLCACRDSGVIQVFAINPTTGRLTDTHQDIPLDRPVCIQFMP